MKIVIITFQVLLGYLVQAQSTSVQDKIVTSKQLKINKQPSQIETVNKNRVKTNLYSTETLKKLAKEKASLVKKWSKKNINKIAIFTAIIAASIFLYIKRNRIPKTEHSYEKATTKFKEVPEENLIPESFSDNSTSNYKKALASKVKDIKDKDTQDTKDILNNLDINQHNISNSIADQIASARKTIDISRSYIMLQDLDRKIQNIIKEANPKIYVEGDLVGVYDSTEKILYQMNKNQARDYGLLIYP